MTSGHDELHDGHAEVAQAGVDAERRALALLREEEADVGHAGGEVAAAQAAQQREQRRIRRVAASSVSCTAKPMPIAGISSEAVEIAVQRRPPKIGTMNE